jgi:hypothetical protein
MMYHYPQEVVLEMVGITLPTKLFTYLTLGIPPVVSEEKKAVCHFIEKYKCGVIVSQKDIANLRPILDAQDYPVLLDNVRKAREELCLEAYLPQLTEYIQTILDRPQIPVEPWNEYESERHQRPFAEAAYVRPTASLPRGNGKVRSPGVRRGRRKRQRAKRRRRNKRRR